MKKVFLCILGGLSLFGLSACKSSINTATVPELDINKFMGHWYEIARFDHRFERGMVGCTADYYLQPGGWVKVVNSGYKNSFCGKFKQSEGKVRRPDAKVPGKLEVSFFLNFYSDYNVLALAPDYRYALIGSKSDKYLWILSRTPKMLPEDLEYLLDEAKSKGYNIDNLIWVEHQ